MLLPFACKGILARTEHPLPPNTGPWLCTAFQNIDLPTAAWANRKSGKCYILNSFWFFPKTMGRRERLFGCPSFCVSALLTPRWASLQWSEPVIYVVKVGPMSSIAAIEFPLLNVCFKSEALFQDREEIMRRGRKKHEFVLKAEYFLWYWWCSLVQLDKKVLHV